MNIILPNTDGNKQHYTLSGEPVKDTPMSAEAVRTVYSAAHVVADPLAMTNPMGSAVLDWDKTLEYRRYLHGLGLGIAEAMDTSQRGMGLDWKVAKELIYQTRQELPDALVSNGCGTDQLDPKDAHSVDDVKRAYFEQLDAIQSVGGRIILMASRALAKVTSDKRDYVELYNEILSSSDQPVILHWLGEMFDPQLAGYWGADNFEQALETVVEIIETNIKKVDGIKISLLDKEKEVILRRRLPAGVKMYTGDDFNYPELITGDEQGYSHALLGIFDPIAAVATKAINLLGEGDIEGYFKTFNPTVSLARKIFEAPTQYYKTGVVFLAWLNGFQDHFVMLNGHQAMRPLSYFVDVFKLADQCGALRNPELAVERMTQFLKIHGMN